MLNISIALITSPTLVLRAASRALAGAEPIVGTSATASTPIIETTTSSSINVNAFFIFKSYLLIVSKEAPLFATKRLLQNFKLNFNFTKKNQHYPPTVKEATLQQVQQHLQSPLQ